ncbi:MAG: caspase family protein [Nitrospirota bacterium]
MKLFKEVTNSILHHVSHKERGRHRYGQSDLFVTGKRHTGLLPKTIALFLTLTLLIIQAGPAKAVVREQEPTALRSATVDGASGRAVDAIAGFSDGSVPSGARLYILAVGINKYENPKYTLRYGRSDAETFVQAVEQHGKNVFSRIITQTIYDTQANRRNIEAAFNRIIAEAQPEDVFVFYYAGHGVLSKGDTSDKPEFYMALTDVTSLTGENAMFEERGLSALLLRNLSFRIKAQKQLLVLDACHSGGALERFAAEGPADGYTPLQLGKSAGITVLAAAGTDQPATEFKQLGHGVFTYALVKGLGGEADRGDAPDGRITVRELEAYLNEQVPALISRYKGKAQSPNSFVRGSDFTLGAKQ